jgi:hypothetical protein
MAQRTNDDFREEVEDQRTGRKKKLEDRKKRRIQRTERCHSGQWGQSNDS